MLSSDPSNFSHTIDISKGSDDGLKVDMPVVNGAGLVGRIVQVTPNRSTVQLITDPDFLVGVRLLGSDLATGTAHGQGQGEDLLVDTRLEPDIDDPPKPGTALTTSGAQLSAFPDSIPVGQGAHGPRDRRRAHARAGRATDGRHGADAVRHRAPLGAADVTPPSPLTVAVRTSFVLVTALTLQLGVLANLALFGVQADLMLLVGHRRRDRRRARTAAPPSGSPPGSSTTSCSRRPSGCPPSPTRSWPTWSAASRTRCSAPRGGSRWPPRPSASVVGVILYGVLGTVLGEDLVGWELLRVAVIVGLLNTRLGAARGAAMRWATGSVNSVRARAVYR